MVTDGQRFICERVAAWTQLTAEAGITREEQNALIVKRFRNVFRDFGIAPSLSERSSLTETP